MHRTSFFVNGSDETVERLFPAICYAYAPFSVRRIASMKHQQHRRKGAHDARALNNHEGQMCDARSVCALRTRTLSAHTLHVLDEPRNPENRPTACALCVCE